MSRMFRVVFIVLFMLGDARSNRKLAIRSRLLSSTCSVVDPESHLRHGRRSRPVQRGAAERYFCNQRGWHEPSIRSRLRRADAVPGLEGLPG